jgi:hypothetical protein
MNNARNPTLFHVLPGNKIRYPESTTHVLHQLINKQPLNQQPLIAQ